VCGIGKRGVGATLQKQLHERLISNIAAAMSAVRPLFTAFTAEFDRAEAGRQRFGRRLRRHQEQCRASPVASVDIGTRSRSAPTRLRWPYWHGEEERSFAIHGIAVHGNAGVQVADDDARAAAP
jgi:hypothetical protein